MVVSISASSGLTSSISLKNISSAAGGSFAAQLATLQNQSASAPGSSASAANSASSTPANSYASDTAVQDFMNYMKETPAQRFEDQWLAAHHLTQADLKAMSPEKHQQIMAQMEQNMKRAIEQHVQDKLAQQGAVIAVK